MEDVEKKDLYFIFCQKGIKSTVINLEKNLVVTSSTKKAEKTISDENNYILYNIQLSNDYKGKPFTITLVDEVAELYVSYIYRIQKEKFKYDLLFEPVYSSSNNLNQIILPFNTQFQIFYEYFEKKGDDNIINTLFLDSIEYISDKKAGGFNLKNVIFLFFEINKLNDKSEEINKQKLLEKFFIKINFDKLFENCLINKININNEVTLDELKLMKNTRKELIKIVGSKQEIYEKINIFILFIMINAKPEFAYEILFENNGENYEIIKTHLLKHKKIFKNFNSEVTIHFLTEATSLESIILVIKDFIPNMLEVLKLFSNYLFYMEFFFQSNNRIINILDLCQPQKDDDPKEFLDYLKNIFDYYRNEGILPIKFDEQFFLSYCDLFENVNVHKIY